jgi:hypothetical protein
MIKKILITLFTLVALLSLTNISTNAIGFPIKTKAPYPPIVGFKCGLGFELYSVKSYNNSTQQPIGTGMRCVKYGDKVQGKISLAWYGEGYENNCSYRTLGHSWWQKLMPNFYPNLNYDKHIAAQADIWGNGECRKNNNDYASTNTSLYTRGDNYGQIELYTSNPNYQLKEVWTKFYSMIWTPLPRITTCGNTVGIVQYTVQDGQASPNTPRSGGGITCVLKFLSPNTTWFAQGNWYNTISGNYTELGTKHPTLGFGTSQIFGGGFLPYGAYALNRPYGSFGIAWGVSGAQLLAPKDETWTF